MSWFLAGQWAANKAIEAVGGSANVPEGVESLTFIDKTADLVVDTENIGSYPFILVNDVEGVNYGFIRVADYVDLNFLVDKSVVTLTDPDGTADFPITSGNIFDASDMADDIPAGAGTFVGEQIVSVREPFIYAGIVNFDQPGLYVMAILTAGDEITSFVMGVTKITNVPVGKLLSQSSIENGLVVIDLADYDIPAIGADGLSYGEGIIDGEYSNTFTEKTKELFDLLSSIKGPVYLRGEITSTSTTITNLEGMASVSSSDIGRNYEVSAGEGAVYTLLITLAIIGTSADSTWVRGLMFKVYTTARTALT